MFWFKRKKIVVDCFTIHRSILMLLSKIDKKDITYYE